MSFFENLINPQAAFVRAKKELAEKGYKMRDLFTFDTWSVSHIFDHVADDLLREAGINKAEDFIAVLKASPLYQEKRCLAMKKKLEQKKEEVRTLERNLRSSC